MGEVRFYHLTAQPLEDVLPVMLERTLARGNRAVVRVPSRERVEFLDRHLWTYADDSFLPHGRDGDPEPALHPVWLTGETAVPNGADTLFLVDGADAGEAELAQMALTAILFSGLDDRAVEFARGQWRRVQAANLTAVYYAQTDRGWEEKARNQGLSA